MSISILEFEKPIAEVSDKIEALQLAATDNPELLPQIDKLKLEETALRKKIYSIYENKGVEESGPGRPNTYSRTLFQNQMRSTIFSKRYDFMLSAC